MAELVDAKDLKSFGAISVQVQILLPAPLIRKTDTIMIIKEYRDNDLKNVHAIYCPDGAFVKNVDGVPISRYGNVLHNIAMSEEWTVAMVFLGTKHETDIALFNGRDFKGYVIKPEYIYPLHPVVDERLAMFKYKINITPFMAETYLGTAIIKGYSGCIYKTESLEFYVQPMSYTMEATIMDIVSNGRPPFLMTYLCTDRGIVSNPFNVAEREFFLKNRTSLIGTKIIIRYERNDERGQPVNLVYVKTV